MSNRELPKKSHKTGKAPSRPTKLQPQAARLQQANEPSSLQAQEQTHQQVDNQISAMQQQIQVFLAQQSSYQQAQIQHLSPRTQAMLLEEAENANHIRMGSQPLENGMASHLANLVGMPQHAELAQALTGQIPHEQLIRATQQGLQQGAGSQSLSQIRPQQNESLGNRLTVQANGEVAADSVANAALGAAASQRRSLIGLASTGEGINCPPPGPVADDNVQPTENGGQEAVSPTESQQQEPPQLLQQLAHVSQVQQVLMEQCRVLCPQLMQQYHPMAQTAPDELLAFYRQHQRDECEHASNQLRLFARRLFSKINQRELRSLSSQADDYLEQCMREQRRAENGDGPGNHGPASNALESILNQDSECGGEHFLDEINKTLQPKRHAELRADFSRFMQSVFEDRAQEQAIVDFMKQMPQIYFRYLNLAQQYHWRYQIGDKKASQALGREIADLILPCAQQANAHLTCCVPDDVLDQYAIQTVDDGAGGERIVSWRYVGGDSANSGDEIGSDDEQADEDGEEEMTEDEQDELESGEAEEEDMEDDDIMRDHAGDLSLVRGRTISSQHISEEAEESVEQDMRSGDSDADMSQLAETPNPRRRPRQGRRLSDSMLEQPSGQPAGTGRNNRASNDQKKYYLSLLNQHCPRNSNEVRTFDSLWKSLRDVKEIKQFTKLLYIYFSGVLNLSEFEMLLYDSKFASRLRQEVINEIKKLLPTRDASRRMQSTLIKPWNDLEKQDFEKIAPDSSYYRIDEEDGSFPIPTCTAKMLNPVYRDNLNDRYLSLATGSEKTETNQQHNIKNSFAEKLYQNEDRLYVRDSHIDNVKKSYYRICKILERFRASSPEEQASFKFPLHELNPLRQYWEHRLARHTDQFLKEGKVIREKELLALKKTVASHLDYLKNQKQLCLNEVKEQFRKNFTKSLDHKSLQYNKDFSNKFNFKRPIHLQRMRQLAEASQLRGQIKKSQLLLLYGAAEVPPESPCRFYNTFGREFARALSQEKLHLPQDHPIDMQFLEVMPLTSLSAIQQKCPQARFQFSDRRIVSLAVMLCIFGLQNNSQQAGGPAQLNESTQALKFMLEFVGVNNYDAIAAQCEQLSLLDQDTIDVLTNSAEFYRKRHNGELSLMQELYVIDDCRTRRESAANHLLDEVYADKEMVLTTQQKEAAKEPLKSSEQTNYNNHQLNITVGDPNLLEKVNKLAQNDEQRASNAAGNPENDDGAVKEGSMTVPVVQLVDTQRLNVENLSHEGDRIRMEHDVHNFDQLDNEEQTDAVARLEDEMKGAIFVPGYRHGRHKLLYASANMYCFMHYFYAVCERLEKGYRLVEAKVKQDFKDDFSHMSLQDKLADIQSQLVHERFQYLVRAIITMMSQPSVLSSNEYDDLARQMLGNDAYLLFQMDKLVSVVLKQLHHFQTDNGCKSARQLYERIEDDELVVRDESCYLTSFFELASKQAEQQPATTLTGAAAANKENANPPLINMAYRLLYSDTSNILCVHYVSFNPFASGAADAKTRPGQGPQQTGYVGACSGWQGSDLDNYLHSLDKLLHEHVDNRKTPFMARSKRKMESVLREAPKLHKNGLIVHKVPLAGNLWYEQGTEDVLQFDVNGLPKVGQKRRRGAVIRQDLQKRRRYLDILEQRRSQVLQLPQSLQEDQEQETGIAAAN